MNDIKEYIKDQIKNGVDEGSLANNLSTILCEALAEVKEEPKKNETSISQTEAINNFLRENCPNLNFTFEESDLKILGEMINTVIPAFEQMIALILDKNMSSLYLGTDNFSNEENNQQNETGYFL